MSTTATTHCSVKHYLPDCAPQHIERVRDILARWSKRSESHFSQRRSAPRHDYTATVEFICHVTSAASEAHGGPTRLVFHVTARNISKGGMGLIVPAVFVSDRVSDSTPLLCSEAVFRPGVRATISLKLPNGQPLTVYGEVVRQRRVHHELYEIGVRLIERQP